MIPNQRSLFDIPADITYLNCAYTSPLLKSAKVAGETAMKQKAAPWTLAPEHFFDILEESRKAFSSLIHCSQNDVAIIPSVSYGISLAAGNLPLRRELRPQLTIVLLEEQFPSNVYAWQRLAAENQAKIVTVARPDNSDWTAAILAAIDDRTTIAALPQCHWTDGSLIDLQAISLRCRQVGAALVVDGTQSLGAMPFSVAEVQPDFLVTTAHKWLLGPYSFAFCYVAPHWQQGRPLEDNWLNREGSQDFSKLVAYRDEFQPGARRYDMGEASNFILAPIAIAALNQILQWGVAEIAGTLQEKTDAIAEQASALGFTCIDRKFSAPHMIGLKKPGGLAENVSVQLAEQKVFVSVRGDCIRISPHLYNTEEDIQRLLEALSAL